jgi:surface polysaccharide O-acyltransferase-like enzyme
MFILDAAQFCESTKEIWSVIGTIITIIQYAIPVIIVLLGTLDLGKAVMAGKDDEIKTAQKMLIKRIIYGVVVFFVVVVVKAIFTGIGHSEATTNACFAAMGFK